MAINKKLIHFKKFTDFNSQKLSANEGDTAYTVGPSGTVVTGAPNILYSTICWIKDTRQMWTHGTLYNCADVDLSDYPTESEIAELYATKTALAAKQDKVLKFENLTASAWVSDATYGDYPYRCDVLCTGVMATDYPEVVLALEQAVSGDYAPLSETKSNVVSIWGKTNVTITIPTIIITR